MVFSQKLNGDTFDRPGRSPAVVIGILALSIVLAACGPLGLVPPTPTQAPDLRIVEQPTMGTSPTAALTRPVNGPTRVPVQSVPTVAPVVLVDTPVPTVELAQANDSAPTPVDVPTPANQGAYPPPAVVDAGATPTPEVVAPAADQGNPAPANSGPPTEPSTSTAAAGAPKVATATATATATKTATPKPQLPATPPAATNYPQAFNTPAPIAPPGGYPV